MLLHLNNLTLVHGIVYLDTFFCIPLSHIFKFRSIDNYILQLKFKKKIDNFSLFLEYIYLFNHG